MENIKFNIVGAITLNISDNILAKNEDEAMNKFIKKLEKKYKTPVHNMQMITRLSYFPTDVDTNL